MKNGFLILTVLLGFSVLSIAKADINLGHANNDLDDRASLQRGARMFVNYCFGCHSTQYQRYKRVAQDIGLTTESMGNDLIVDRSIKPGDLMENAIPLVSAEKWFGTTPPDLTLVARVRGVDWVYNYLRTFYVDDSRPFGVNNLVLPNTGMPHVLESLQGSAHPVYETGGQEGKRIVALELDGQGELSAIEYDNAIRDLVNFLEYSSEPMKLERQALGWWVMGFLTLFFSLVILLKKEYWRDVH